MLFSLQRHFFNWILHVKHLIILNFSDRFLHLKTVSLISYVSHGAMSREEVLFRQKTYSCTRPHTASCCMRQIKLPSGIECCIFLSSIIIKATCISDISLVRRRRRQKLRSDFLISYKAHHEDISYFVFAYLLGIPRPIFYLTRRHDHNVVSILLLQKLDTLTNTTNISESRQLGASCDGVARESCVPILISVFNPAFPS